MIRFSLAVAFAAVLLFQPAPGVTITGARIVDGTGAAPRMDDTANRDGTNATVKPGSQESGSEPAGEPAPQRR